MIYLIQFFPPKIKTMFKEWRREKKTDRSNSGVTETFEQDWIEEKTKSLF